MELGTGIFLSAVFLGTVSLFIATKDRWNWKKIFVWPLGIVVALWMIAFAINYVYDHNENQPKKMTALWSIALGASTADVKFLKGEPTSKNGNTWVYQDGINNDRAYSVGFRDAKVRFVMYSGPMYDAPAIKGLDEYGTLQDTEAKFGKASNVSISNDGLRRTFSFEKFNLGVEYEKGSIRSVGIYDPTTSPLAYKDEIETKPEKGAISKSEEREFQERLADEMSVKKAEGKK